MSRERDNRSTAERMQDRLPSIHFSPTIPARAHMPFVDHRDQRQVHYDQRMARHELYFGDKRGLTMRGRIVRRGEGHDGY